MTKNNVWVVTNETRKVLTDLIITEIESTMDARLFDDFGEDREYWMKRLVILKKFVRCNELKLPNTPRINAFKNANF